MTRQRRGRDSELRLAEYLRANGYPNANAANAYAPGMDITGTPWSIEVKARTRLDIPAGLRQAATHGTPLLIVRPNGVGTTDIGKWWAITNLENLRRPDVQT